MGLSVSGRTCLPLDLQFLSASACSLYCGICRKQAGIRTDDTAWASALRGADSMAACSDWHGE